jgi:hypothetical protein
MQMPKYAKYLVYLLPMLHLAAFLGGWLGHDFANLLLIDAPLSALFMGLDYKGVNPIFRVNSEGGTAMGHYAPGPQG